ncbi:tetraprenyl-beta-curcumene synthase family protein [Neobacillus notoginsengisoli]|uniref:Tetraprenyl-beta-curcumene synthase family protein n=1 Tax=Neobacillus notoginsengisoli TaxID=1578198 RepID=A0A417YUJ7_9BACI|nr:tetraprenyl-beta-curcumene synthase family protein [Neobacillus notoginsengisoli]RHW40819.1 tetraprenyl-beta-curcumene synthase family protein [Neobacillus notoginsengisoli]
MAIPVKPASLMAKTYKTILPAVREELSHWKKRAEAIPNEELRRQALASIETKTFHCEGGAILALIAKKEYRRAIKFIVAYQTISDYLDNLCDRSTSLDPDDFASLHDAMFDALLPAPSYGDYYSKREDRDDGGYLAALVDTCKSVLESMERYPVIKDHLLDLCGFYCELQVHKHVIPEEREGRLIEWFARHKKRMPEMEWYEFSACSGSTLGIFCLVSYALGTDFLKDDAQRVMNGYFPYIQGLHILLDYLIDQEEDREGGDLNFCFYYQSQEALFERLMHFIKEADRHTEGLPNPRFHRLINRGLLGIYLSDEKVRSQAGVRRLAKKIIQYGGPVSRFFYINGIAYRLFQKVLPN